MTTETKATSLHDAIEDIPAAVGGERHGRVHEL
jgi:hypothetical protein